jgi:hypothetical protein
MNSDNNSPPPSSLLSDQDNNNNPSSADDVSTGSNSADEKNDLTRTLIQFAEQAKLEGSVYRKLIEELRVKSEE